MGKKRKLAFKIADMVCEDCTRAKSCTGCPVRQLVDIYNEKDKNKIVNRVIISGPQIEYLTELGVLDCDGRQIGLVKVPDTNSKFGVRLLCGAMYDSLVRGTFRKLRVRENTNESLDTLTPWIIPEWMFFDRQEDIMREYFGGER